MNSVKKCTGRSINPQYNTNMSKITLAYFSKWFSYATKVASLRQLRGIEVRFQWRRLGTEVA